MFDKDGNRKLREPADNEDVEIDSDIVDLTKQMETHKINAQEIKRIIDKINDKKPQKKVPPIKLEEINLKIETK